MGVCRWWWPPLRAVRVPVPLIPVSPRSTPAPHPLRAGAGHELPPRPEGPRVPRAPEAAAQLQPDGECGTGPSGLGGWGLRWGPSCAALSVLLVQVTPLFTSVPGFLRLEVTGIRWVPAQPHSVRRSLARGGGGGVQGAPHAAGPWRCQGAVLDPGVRGTAGPAAGCPRREGLVLEYDALFAAERVPVPALDALLDAALGSGGSQLGLVVGAAPVLRNVALGECGACVGLRRHWTLLRPTPCPVLGQGRSQGGQCQAPVLCSVGSGWHSRSSRLCRAAAGPLRRALRLPGRLRLRARGGRERHLHLPLPPRLLQEPGHLHPPP